MRKLFCKHCCARLPAAMKCCREAAGASLTLAAWTARSSYAEGRRVRVSLTEEIFEGTTRGLEPDGALRVETDTGQIRLIRAGDVTTYKRDEKQDEG